jgi:NitT/TauT family transport system permease protein
MPTKNSPLWRPLRPWLRGGWALVLLLALWTGLAALLTEQRVVPYPRAVWEVLQEADVQADLRHHALISLRRLLVGMGSATLLAYPIGVLLGQNAFLHSRLSGFINLLHVIPKVVFLPVIFVLLGIGDASKVFLVGAVVFFQMVVVVRDEALAIPSGWLEAVRALGAGRLAQFRLVYLPASLAAVLTGWRVSVATAVAVLFIAELNLTRTGLGYYISTSNNRFRYEEMYAGILTMSLLGLGLYALTDGLERFLLPWRRAESAQKDS